MKRENLSKITKKISGQILEAKSLCELLNELEQGEHCKCTLLSVIIKKLKISFDNIELVRELLN